MIIGNEGILSIVLALERTGQDDAVVVQLEVSVFGHLQEVVLHHFVQNVHTKHFQRMGGEVQSAEYLFEGKVFAGTHLHPGHQLPCQFALSHVLSGFLFFLLCHGGYCFYVY